MAQSQVQVPPPAAPDVPPPKTSRYRSLRGKSVSSRFNLFRDSESKETTLPRIRAKSVTAARSSSASASLSNAPPLPTNLPPIPNFVLSANPKNDSSPSLIEKKALDQTSRPPSSTSLSAASSSTLLVTGPPRSQAELDHLAAQLDLEIDEARRIKEEELRKRRAELRKKEEEEAARYADEVARLEAETDRILAEQRKLDFARQQALVVSTPSPLPKPKRIILEKLSLFSRSKKSSTTSSQPPGTPSTIAPTIFTPNLSRSSSLEGSPPPPERMSFIDQGTKGDAPVSAINGGERRVTVRYLSSTINLEVTADTTPVDILKAAAAQSRHDLDIESSVVIECYDILGLERRLRRYEHVRNTLNSWDRDQENSLLVMTCDPSENNQNLYASSVPQTDEPAFGFTVQLYQSSRPGKWNKRFVTLLNTGQMFASKRADAKPSDKDSTSLCHLSDFDIYKPKESEMRRNLKPPKKFCFAIKSQQKTVVFPNGENFVHFFSTEDARLAERFFELVHSWRSWYLVNSLIHTRAPEKAPQLNVELDVSKKAPTRESLRQPSGNGLAISTGSFIDDSDFTKAIEESTKKLALEAQRQKSVSRRKVSGASVATSVRSNEREFAASGLLGHAYEKRKGEVEATTDVNGKKIDKVDGPFTEGPSLLNRIASSPQTPEQPEPKSWFPSASEHTARHRSPSIRRPMTADVGAHSGRDKGTQPLLNFANDFPEPPRPRDGFRVASGSGPGSRYGQGLRPPAGSPLINFATGGPAGDRLGPPPRNGAPPPPNMRGRSRSAAGPINARRFPPAEDLPPIPPASHRGPGPKSNRMPQPHKDSAPRNRDARRHDRPQERPQEPLVHRAR